MGAPPEGHNCCLVGENPLYCLPELAETLAFNGAEWDMPEGSEVWGRLEKSKSLVGSTQTGLIYRLTMQSIIS